MLFWNLRVRWSFTALGLVFALVTLFIQASFAEQAASAPVRTADMIWIESESPAAIAPSSLKPVIENVGRPTYLSSGQWLHVNVEVGELDKSVPADGLVLTYNFAAPAAAIYNLWNRIGFEKIRSPFDWRVDGGEWATALPSSDTVDVEELQTWAPVGWLPLGTSNLSAGPHTLQFRIRRSKDDKGNPAKIVYASDAICLTPKTFFPDGPHRPGDPSAQTSGDKAAAAHVFTLTVPVGSAQTASPLSGDWQIAAADEAVVTDRLGPIQAVPNASDLSWHSIAVPGDRNHAFPEMSYVHRYFLRTQVTVPAALTGHAFYLHVPSQNMIATVFVNGRQCGWTKNPYAAWDCDVTSALKPGQVNELWVGIKDAFYGLADTSNLKHPQYLPFDFWHYNATNQLDMPVLGHFDNGLLHAPTLIVAGKAYTSDVFAIPSVKNKTLGLEVTLHNPAAQPVTVSLANKVVPLAGGSAEKTFASQEVTVPAGGDIVVKLSAPWANPKLWWPDTPNQYSIVTTVSVAGQAADERVTKFGFREWDWHGPNFVLNGVPFHGRADLAAYNQADDAAVALWHKHGQTMQRMWGEGLTSGLEPEAALDFYDAHGIVLRRTGIFDGEGVAGFYNLSEEVNGKYGPHRALFENWRQQLAAWVKGQRNHPSIFLWSMENEITFINSKVFGNNPLSDPEMKKAADMLSALDPTRPQMTDGGNGLLDESLPVYGGHYMDPPLSSLPEGAYDKAAFTHRQIWPMSKVKPFLIGESYFLSGIDLSDLATVGGEAAFVGKSESHPAGGLAARMLSEGYRWNDVSFHFWFGGETDLHYNSWQPIAVLCRQWDSTFRSGQKVTRTLGIFNDTHETQPISLTWTLAVGGKKTAIQTSLHKVGPGLNTKFNVVVPMPLVTTRQEGTWILALAINGKPVFQDVRPVSILSPAFKSVRLYHRTAAPTVIRAVGPAASKLVAIYDPTGSVISYLTGQHVPFLKISSLSQAPATAKVLVIGKDALTPAQSTSSQLAAYASAGKVVIVLEQKNPLHYQAIPGEMAAETNAGGIAFMEDPDSPVLRGLQQHDFLAWGPDNQVYRNAYIKPASGGKSLVQCSSKLQNTALAQLSVGKGIMLISQLLIGEKLGTNPVAQQLLLNMVSYGQSYKQVFHPVSAVAGDNLQLIKVLDATGLQYTKTMDPLIALSKPGSIAVLTASPANLKVLAANPAKVSTFTQGGGWLLFNNLTPDGLADYNKIVGYDHMIRPYGQEKVTWPIVRSPLTAGLATSNIVIGSGKQVFWFAAGQYPDTDAFSYVLDYDEVAPFGKSTFSAWDKITNNYTQADGFWPLIINLPAPSDGKPLEIPIVLPKAQTITRFTYVQDLNYGATTKISLVFDGKDTLSFPLPASGDPQTFEISPPRTAQKITLQLNDWEHTPSKKQDGKDLVGIDNIYLHAKRPANFTERVKPILNIGAMLEYPRGSGGIVLCNVKFKDTETNPENIGKKQTILATVLRNLNAPFSGGKTIIAGASNLTFAPIDIKGQVNQYVTDQGFFGDKQFTFADLPRGKQPFAGVTYNIYNFTTSPVPNVMMLGGDGVPGNLADHISDIPVGRKADALFFLQAARIDQRRNGDELRDNKHYEMADYIVHYADGQTVKVPIYAEISVENYKQKLPAALPGAQIAWTKPYSGTDQTAVAYSMQWNNLRPETVIQSIDLVYGPDRRGIPALLAVTAAAAH